MALAPGKLGAHSAVLLVGMAKTLPALMISAARINSVSARCGVIVMSIGHVTKYLC